jgi:hypothetical protein
MRLLCLIDQRYKISKKKKTREYKEFLIMQYGFSLAFFSKIRFIIYVYRKGFKVKVAELTYALDLEGSVIGFAIMLLRNIVHSKG